MIKILALLMMAGAAQAQSFLVTGTITQDMGGNTQIAGESLQFEYTINPLVNPDQDPSQRGPITSISYSINGEAFKPDNGWGTVDMINHGFTLYPGSGSMISYDAVKGKMLVYDYSLNGAFANVTSVQQTSQAPEIDPAGLASGLTLLIGGLLVLRGRREMITQ